MTAKTIVLTYTGMYKGKEEILAHAFVDSETFQATPCPNIPVNLIRGIQKDLETGMYVVN